MVRQWLWNHAQWHWQWGAGQVCCAWPTELVFRVTTCLENLEMPGKLTAVRKMSGILLKVRKMSAKCQGKNLVRAK